MLSLYVGLCSRKNGSNVDGRAVPFPSTGVVGHVGSAIRLLLAVWLVFLVAVAASVAMPSAAQAACVAGPAGTITCSGNDVGGGARFTNPPNPYDTLNVNNLLTNIAPGAGLAGFSLIGQGTDQPAGGCDCYVLVGFGDDGADGGGAPAVTVTYQGGANTLQTDGASGVVGISYGGDGGNGGSGFGVGGSGGDGGNGALGGTVTVDSAGTIVTTGNQANGILALSVGGNGGQGGDFDGGIADAGNGGAAAGGGSVSVISRSNITTYGDESNGIVAQSTGGKGGAGGSAGGIWADSGGGGAAAPGGAVTVDNFGFITTNGKASSGIYAQSVGGFGGNGGDGFGLVQFGGNAASAGEGSTVTVNHSGTIATHDTASHGILAQSIGGGGGTGGTTVSIVALGSAGGVGGKGGAVNVTTSGQGHISTDGDNAKGIYAQSIGGGGGDGGTSVGIASVGGTGSTTSIGGTVTINNGQAITTNGARSDAIYAQSIGGGGGSGGVAVGFAALGGSGAGGGNGGTVSVRNSATLSATGTYAHGIFAQSIGGGGGDGGFATGLFGMGGSAGAGSNGLSVTIENTGNITANGHDGGGIFAQSIGGGGGTGGGTATAGAFISAGFGGTGGGGGDGGNVHVNQVANLAPSIINVTGDRANGILAQSIGGGGGNGGFAISASAGPFGSASLAFGGSGGSGGDGLGVNVGANGGITTNGSFSSGIVAESIGGGGGRGGFAISAAASTGGAINASFGGTGGDGGVGGIVNVDTTVNITTGCEACTHSNGIMASSIGGGGGSGGFAISATGAIVASVGATFGGGGGAGNQAQTVDVDNIGTISTTGAHSNGILAQSLGGGGGNGGFAVGAGVSLQGGTSVFAFGGSAGGGASGEAVTADNIGDITTRGDFSNGILAQSIGGGGGTGGFSAAAGFSLQGASASNSFGGSGGAGSDGRAVDVSYSGNLNTYGDFSNGIFAQSVGGGGGTGGFAIGASVTINSPSMTNSIGGDAGNGGAAGNVAVTEISGSITTRGAQSHGILAQSVAGGGGTGGFSLGAGVSIKSTTVDSTVGGDAGSGASAGTVTVDSAATIRTGGEDGTGAWSHGILAQSIGGGGGTGGFSGTANFSLKGDAKGFATGGDGSSAGAGSTVTVTSSGAITTLADNSIGIFAQSVGGGGGAGGFAVTVGGSMKGNADVNSVGGDGAAAGDGGEVTVTVLNDITTSGMLSHGVLAQSVGGGGGYGGFSLAGSFSIEGDSSTQSVGGEGGGAGVGQTVRVTIGEALAPGAEIRPIIHTTGLGAVGVLAQSIGGGGGTGGFAGALTVAPKGSAANEVTGGNGGAGSKGGDVYVTNFGLIRTENNNAAGILAQSVGGGGGNGGFSIAGSFEKDGDGAKSATGGTGAAGADGGYVEVTNNGVIETSGHFSHGILAQSVGGGGGNGGFSIAATISDSGSGATSSVGGEGAAGGNGGNVRVVNNGTIIVGSENSHGIFAQSVGGSGGNGGIAGAFDFGGGGVDNVVGGDGAKGGNGGDVTVISTGSIHTTKANSNGVFAQSVGGSGGWAGLALGIGDGGDGASGLKLSLGSKCTLVGGDDEEDPCDVVSLIPVDGSTGTVTVTVNGETNVTEGALSFGMIAQSIAAGGGSAATVILDQLGFSGSDVFVEAGSDGFMGGNASFVANQYNTLQTLTTGVGAIGIINQSIGGGGGNASTAIAGLVLNPAIPLEDGFYLRAGGYSGDVGYDKSGSGGAFDVDIAGSVETRGANAIGVVAQTIGGGGGIANLTVGTIENGGEEMRIIVGGSQLNGDGYRSDAVLIGAPQQLSTLDVEGVVTTSGVLSHGIVAQSIGGGGGISNVVLEQAVALDNGFDFTLGGYGGGAGGNGSDLLVTAHGVTTTGAGAFGIVGQSIGGGGGLIGLANGSSLLGQSFSGSITQAAAGATGDGGVVTINSYGNIHTAGIGAHGIVAQSIGGSGGILGTGMYVDAALPFAGSRGAAGTASAVNVTHTGNIVVTGQQTVGIFAQSEGGTANGNIAVVIDHAGTDGNGVGLVWASSGTGAAIQLADGLDNTLSSNGTLYAAGSIYDGITLPDLGGLAILGGLGNDVVTNEARLPTDPNVSPLSGVTRTSNIIGNIDLGAGSNALINEAGALMISGTDINIGTGLLTNQGFLAVGDRGRVNISSVTGDFAQTSTGAYYIDLDLNAQNTPDRVNDLLEVSGTAAFDGEGPLLFLSIDKAFSNAGYVIASAGNPGGMTDNGFMPTLTPPAVGFIFSAEVQAADLVLLAEKPPFLDMLEDPASGVTDPNVLRMGGGLDNIEQAIGIDDQFNYLINLLRLQPDEKALGDAVATLTPHQAPHLYELVERRTSDFIDHAMNGCQDSFAASPVSCFWAVGAGGYYERGVVQDSPTARDEFKSLHLGGKAAIDDSLGFGLALGMTQVNSVHDREGVQLSTMQGDLYQASLSADHKSGNFGLSFVAAGTAGVVATSRHVQVDGFEQTYNSFDGIATGVEGVGELPIFSDKVIDFEGIDGNATSDAEIYALNPRLRLSYGSDETDAGLQLTGLLDIEGHLLYTPERTETGAGLANLTYSEMLQSAVTLAPGVELRLITQLENDFEVTGFVRGGLMWSPWKNAWVAETQFAAAPDGLPPIEIIEPFDDLRGKLDVGVQLACASSGVKLTANYAGVFGATTTEHQLRGALTVPIHHNKNGGSC